MSACRKSDYASVQLDVKGDYLFEPAEVAEILVTHLQSVLNSLTLLCPPQLVIVLRLVIVAFPFANGHRELHSASQTN
jgi:hypothetical protein